MASLMEEVLELDMVNGLGHKLLEFALLDHITLGAGGAKLGWMHSKVMAGTNAFSKQFLAG